MCGCQLVKFLIKNDFMEKNAARVGADDCTISFHPWRISSEKHLAAYSRFSGTVFNII